MTIKDAMWAAHDLLIDRGCQPFPQDTMDTLVRVLSHPSVREPSHNMVTTGIEAAQALHVCQPVWQAMLDALVEEIKEIRS